MRTVEAYAHSFMAPLSRFALPLKYRIILLESLSDTWAKALLGALCLSVFSVVHFEGLSALFFELQGNVELVVIADILF